MLERSPNFADLDIPDIPTGNIERITTRIVGSAREQAEDVLDGKLDYMQDPPPAGPRCGRSSSRRPTATSSTRPPRPTTSSSTSAGRRSTTRSSARRSTGRSTARRSRGRYGGAMEPGCTLLAPGVPGYDERLDTVDCPYGDPSEPPDLGRARALIRQAGAEGRAGHGLGQQGGRLAGGDRGLRADAERDRARRPHEAGRPGLLLRDDQRPADARADRLRHLVRGLPPSARLLRRRRRRLDPADQQPEPGQRRRPADRLRDRPPARGRRPRLGGRGLAAARRLRGLAAAELHRPLRPQAGRDLLLRAHGPRRARSSIRSTATTTRAGG